jgi:hypothetical protein
MDLPDQSSQPFGPQLPRRGRPTAPTEVARGRHTEDPAAALDVVAPARSEQQSPGISFGRNSASVNNADAFFVISSSVSGSWIRRRAWASSTRSTLDRARLLSAIDPVLRSPPVDRGLAHPDLSSHDADRAPSPNKLYHLPAEFRRIRPRHHTSPFLKARFSRTDSRKRGPDQSPSHRGRRNRASYRA